MPVNVTPGNADNNEVPQQLHRRLYILQTACEVLHYIMHRKGTVEMLFQILKIPSTFYQAAVLISR